MVPVVASLLLYKAEKPSVSLSVCHLSLYHSNISAVYAAIQMGLA